MRVTTMRAFVNERGEHGNGLAIIQTRDRLGIDVSTAIAREQGFSESVFLYDSGQFDFFSAQGEVKFAGHAAVGLTWFLARSDSQFSIEWSRPGYNMRGWVEGPLAWVSAPLRATPSWWHERRDSAQYVEELTGPENPLQDATQIWAWIDPSIGHVRARTFAARFELPEDEATGSASMRLSAALGRDLLMLHGSGSVLHARPGGPGVAMVGGLVIVDGESDDGKN